MFKSHSFNDFYGPNQPHGIKMQGSLRYFIRFCRGDTKSHVQWTGHLGCTDRASDIHYIFTSEITQPKYHLITSHLVPTVIHHIKLTTQLSTHHKYLGETWTGHLGCARKKVSVCVLFSTTSSGKILGLYPRKTFYKPEFNIFRKKLKNYGTTLILGTKQIWQGIWGAGSVHD